MVLSKDLKIAICFGLIIGVILSVCNLCFASESVHFTVVDNVGINTSGVLISYTGDHLAYFEIEPGYTYTVTRSTSSFKCGFSDTVPEVNLQLDNFQQYLTTFSFSYSDYSYFYFNFANYTDGTYTVTREPIAGMGGFIDNMAYSLSIGELSSVWVLVVPILAISVLLGLGFYLLKRLLNRIKRAKGGA